MSWEDRAACHPDRRPAHIDHTAWTALWFPSPGASQTAALAICQTCPVQAECAASGACEMEGIWGGQSARRRRITRALNPNRKLKPVNHGTEGGFQTHKRRGEEPCEPCVQAKALAVRLRSLRKKEAAA